MIRALKIMITLITGGIKSGKSNYALELASKFEKCAFVATADPDDLSMKKKIENHRNERVNLPMTTYEVKLDIPDSLLKIQLTHDAVVLDCLTMWLSNLMFHLQNKVERQKIFEKFISVLRELKVPCIIITNEVGLGIIPENKLAREYGEELGILNQKTAQVAKSVVMMISGLSVKLK